MNIERIKVLDYRELGRKFIQWARDQSSRPKTLDEFVQQTEGIVDTLPSYIQALVFVQSGKEVLFIRLPPAEMVEDTLQELTADPNEEYALPSFYEERLTGGGSTNNLEFFEKRVGDYTIAHCR